MSDPLVRVVVGGGDDAVAAADVVAAVGHDAASFWHDFHGSFDSLPCLLRLVVCKGEKKQKKKRINISLVIYITFAYCCCFFIVVVLTKNIS